MISDYHLDELSGYIFILYLIIAGNYTNNLFSCKIQYFFENNILIKHILGFMTLYFFTVLSKDNHKNPTYTLAISVFIYALFLLSSKTNIIHLSITLFIIFTIYVLKSYKDYYNYRIESGNELQKYEKKFLNMYDTIIYILVAIVIINMILGSLIYLGNKKMEYKIIKKQWSWYKYILGNVECSFNKKQIFSKTHFNNLKYIFK